MLVAIDGGYDKTKVYYKSKGKEESFSIHSRYEEYLVTMNTNNTWHFSFGGKNYIVGEGAEIYNFDRDKTKDELHKICTYMSLARLSNCVGTNFNLVVTYPMNIYESASDDFAEYLITDGMIETEYEGEKKVFAVNDCTVIPQGAGTIYTNSEEYKDSVIGLLDIGKLTINGGIFVNNNMINSTVFTEDMGIGILQTKIKNALMKVYKEPLPDYLIEEIIRDGYTIKGVKQHDANMIIDNVINKHIKTLIRVMKSNGWNVDSTKIVLTGGGSIQLHKHLIKHFPQAILAKDPVYDSARGSYRIGKAIYGSEDA